MSLSGLLAVAEVNELDKEHFLWLFSNIIDRWPHAAAKVFDSSPFCSADHIVESLNSYLDMLPTQNKEDLLRMQPEIGTNVRITIDASREQQRAGLDRLSETETEQISFLNTRYRERFGFPFIVCVQGMTIETITETLQKRFTNLHETEVRNAMEEIKKIGKLRIMELVWHD